KCQLINFCWDLLPLTRFRLWLLNVHFDQCSDCQASLANREESLKILSGKKLAIPVWLIQEELWLKRGSSEERRQPNSGLRIKRKAWLTGIYATVSVLVVFILMFSFGWRLGRQRSENDYLNFSETNKTNIVSRVSLEYVRSGGQPADTFIYHTRDPQMTIIWVETRD
ncbi:MAG: hypothetical protein ACPLRA_03500, partial [Candidatus Saccharicenans sp.]